MRAVRVSAPGGPRRSSSSTSRLPRPSRDTLSWTIAAAGVNFIDTYQRSGIYRVPYPLVLGGEGAGRVRAVGPGVEGIAVATGSRGRAAPVRTPSRPPSRRSGVCRSRTESATRPAAALLLQGTTAHYLCTSTYPVAAGDIVLVHAGAGGVGLLLTQLIRRRGGVVITTVGSADKAELSRAAGANHVIGYDEVADTVRTVTDGMGLAAVFDGVGKDTFRHEPRQPAAARVMVLFGASSGPVPPVDPQRLNSGGSLFLTRPTLGDYLATREELRWRAGERFAAVIDGSLTVRIGREPSRSSRRSRPTRPSKGAGRPARCCCSPECCPDRQARSLSPPGRRRAAPLRSVGSPQATAASRAAPASSAVSVRSGGSQPEPVGERLVTRRHLWADVDVEQRDRLDQVAAHPRRGPRAPPPPEWSRRRRARRPAGRADTSTGAQPARPPARAATSTSRSSSAAQVRAGSSSASSDRRVQAHRRAPRGAVGQGEPGAPAGVPRRMGLVGRHLDRDGYGARAGAPPVPTASDQSAGRPRPHQPRSSRSPVSARAIRSGLRLGRGLDRGQLVRGTAVRRPTGRRTAQIPRRRSGSRTPARTGRCRGCRG